jgi:hypothetical protein
MSNESHKQLRRALEAGILCESEILDAVAEQTTGLSNPGFCLSCGNQQEGCEPDARGYKCESCGEKTVYGAEELLMHL